MTAGGAIVSAMSTASRPLIKSVDGKKSRYFEFFSLRKTSQRAGLRGWTGSLPATVKHDPTVQNTTANTDCWSS